MQLVMSPSQDCVSFTGYLLSLLPQLASSLGSLLMVLMILA